jgi:hypothetical protein
MRFHWQNLNDSDPKRYWLYGRAWLGSLGVEWHAPGGCRWSVTFGGGDAGRNLSVAFSVPFLLTLYVTLGDVFPRQLFEYDFDRGSDRQIGCYFFEWTFHYDIWVGTMASWSRVYPWCQWWRQGSIDFKNLLLGRQKHQLETLKHGIPVVIPMPEGVYHGTAKIERRTWKRPLWFAFSRVSTVIDCPKGIPFAGKGENSWDCGDDGLFGWGSEGRSVEKAIAHGVQSVLESRRRHGMPSQQAINDAVTPR